MINKRINVVTGASGRIGFALCLELKKRGEYVRALCRSENKVTELLRGIADEIAFGDITDYESLLNAFEPDAIIYHLAGVVSIESAPSELLEKVNIGGTQNVIAACLEQNIRRLVFVGSVHSVPFNNRKQVLTEPDYYQPDKICGAYAKSKAKSANLVLDAVKKGLDAVVAMPSGVIGPYEYTKSNIGQMIADVASKRLKIYIKGEYDFVDVRDVAFALCELADKGIKGESYFVSGYKATVKQLLCAVADSAKVNRPRFGVPTFLVKLVAPIAEKRSLKKGEKPTFTPYSIRVLHDNCNFCRDKLGKLTDYSPRTVAESIKDQVDFYFEFLAKE